jgi:YD repeat-containing protein
MVGTRIRAAGAVSILSIGLSATASAQHVVLYDYDSLGQLIKIDGPNGDDRRYVFDDSGNRIIARSAPNSPPIARDDFWFLQHGTATKIVDLRDNDTDPNGHPMTVTRIFNISHTGSGGAATIYLRPDGRVNITPGGGGTTSFAYEVTDQEAVTTGTGQIETTTPGGGIDPGCGFFC